MTFHTGKSGPGSAGFGLRLPHLAEVMAVRPTAAHIEIHPENHIRGPLRNAIVDLRRDHQVSVHAVGLSLGSAGGLDSDHLLQVAAFVNEVEPFVVSDHLSWSVVSGSYLGDLLPLPYTDEALRIVARNIGIAQDVLGRPIAIENPSTYLRFRHGEYGEAEFLAELARNTGCRILLDLNNLYVSANNVDLDIDDYLDALPAGSVCQYHLAGHAANVVGDTTILIDDHGSAVCHAVWQLLARAVDRFGAHPTTIEWDSDLPPFETLICEVGKANHVLQAAAQGRGHV